MVEQERKRELKKALKEKERAEKLASLPLSANDLYDLFTWLDREDAPACDNTLRETIEFLQERKLDVDKVGAWLREHSGFCDCEVVYNVEDKFGELIGR
jgi:hypothetical protein